MGHLVQADVVLPGRHGRFWMDSCAGRDQVAMQLLQSGWTAFEAPLPLLVAMWSWHLRPTFLDIGANTGFYSLLSLVSGAPIAHAFEPVTEILDVLLANAASSELGERLRAHPLALGDAGGTAPLYLPLAGHGLVETSASLNRAFRVRHSAVREVSRARLDTALPPAGWDGRPVLMKIDVESHEPAVLRGARQWLQIARPAVVCEMLPATETDPMVRQLAEAGYLHFVPLPDRDPGRARLVATAEIRKSLEHRDHVFLPAETAERWLASATGLSPP
ncbi:hypothetical protein STVA_15080 [Allostella vacuolata]|nr:hypothetical protein STVA_15080 [Stella vacuolata]